MKFGGTSVGEADCIRRVADIVEPHHAAGDEVALVVSACSGVTDQIIAMADEVAASKKQPPVETFLQALRTRHTRLLAEVAPDYVEEVTAIIDDRLNRLQNILLRSMRNWLPVPDYGCILRRGSLAPIVSAASASAV